MSGPLRSRQGCWTCRLRKKKCDERRPLCLTCESLSITCYGFGPKPEWMDNGERERAVANSLKEIVKHTWRRKAKPQSSRQRDPSHPITRLAPRPSDGSVENFSSRPGSSHHGPIPLLDHGLSHEDGIDILQDGSTDLPAPEHDVNLMAGSISSVSADESVLFMHFLDHVFPLQYPMYKPGILEGGRGWIHALLLRTHPLYHAALALSAYHRRTILLAKILHPCRASALIQQEKHLESCIKSLNEFVQNSCPYNGLGIATSVVQLMFFELFTGHDNAWQVHLRAALSMYERAYNENLAHFGLAEKSRTILCEDLPLSEYGPVVSEQVANFRFLASTMIWLDVISSMTAGTAPHLLPYHACVIGSNSQIKLEDIMGCRNWVMLQIGRIAALHERKTQALQQGDFDCTEFEQTVLDIGREIEGGITQEALEGFNIVERDSATMLHIISDQPTLITRMFAYMASIYLHLVTHGFQKLELLDAIISEAMKMLQTQISIHLLPALVAPLYVIGSVAAEGNRQLFRNVFSSTPLVDPLLQHRGRMLPILEEIWSIRRTRPSFEWKDSLELGHNILLL